MRINHEESSVDRMVRENAPKPTIDMSEFLEHLSKVNGGEKFEFIGFVSDEEASKKLASTSEVATVDEAISSSSREDLQQKRVLNILKDVELIDE